MQESLFLTISCLLAIAASLSACDGTTQNTAEGGSNQKSSSTISALVGGDDIIKIPEYSREKDISVTLEGLFASDPETQELLHELQKHAPFEAHTWDGHGRSASIFASSKGGFQIVIGSTLKKKIDSYRVRVSLPGSDDTTLLEANWHDGGRLIIENEEEVKTRKAREMAQLFGR